MVANSNGSGVSGLPGGQEPSILLVDPDTKSQRIVEVALKKAGFRVTSRTGLEEGLAAFIAERPELVLTEARLPDGPGLELLARIRRAGGDRTSILVVSTDRSQEARVRAIQAGALDYLPKPLFAREVVARALAIFEHKGSEAVARNDGPETIEGSLSGMGLVDALQIIEAGKKTGTIIIRSSANESRGLAEDGDPDGEIWFENGWMVGAHVGARRGEEAVHRMLCFEEGTYSFSNGPVARTDAPVPISALLIEGLARIDAWQALAPRLPSLRAQLRVEYRKLPTVIDSLPGEIAEMLSMFDGRRTIRNVLDESRLRDLETLAAVARLLDEGVLMEGSTEPRMASTLDAWLSKAPETSAPARTQAPVRAASQLLPRTRTTALPEPIPTEPPAPRREERPAPTMLDHIVEPPRRPVVNPSLAETQIRDPVRAPIVRAPTKPVLPESQLESTRSIPAPNRSVLDDESPSELWEIEAQRQAGALRRSPLEEAATLVIPPSARLPQETTAVPRNRVEPKPDELKRNEPLHRAVPSAPEPRKSAAPTAPNLRVIPEPRKSEPPPPRRSEPPPPRRSEPPPRDRAPVPKPTELQRPVSPRGAIYDGSAPASPASDLHEHAEFFTPEPRRSVPPPKPLPLPKLADDNLEEFHAAEERRKARVMMGMFGVLALLMIWFFFLQPRQQHIPAPLPTPRPAPKDPDRKEVSWPAIPSDESIQASGNAHADAGVAPVAAPAEPGKTAPSADEAAKLAAQEAEKLAAAKKVEEEKLAAQKAEAEKLAAAKKAEEEKLAAQNEEKRRAELKKAEEAKLAAQKAEASKPPKSETPKPEPKPTKTPDGLDVGSGGKGLAKAEKALAAEDYATAKAEFNEVIRREPRNANAHAGLAFVHYASGELPAAKRVAKWALELDPKNARALLTLGSAALEENDTKGGLEAFRKFLQVAPKHPRAGEIRALVASLEKKSGS